MRAARIACAVAGICHVSGAVVTRYAPRSPTSTSVSTRVRTLSSRKKGFPSVRAISNPPSGARLWSSPRSAVSRGVGALRPQRVDPQLEVVGLATPGMLVLRPVVDEEQDAGGRQALHEAVQQRLGLGVDPVEILEERSSGWT
jgi:hypothetical protein